MPFEVKLPWRNLTVVSGKNRLPEVQLILFHGSCLQITSMQKKVMGKEKQIPTFSN